MVQLDDSDYAVLEDIDLNKVSALSITHTVAYVNQATAVLVRHLNRFGIAADEKLRQISAGIARVETELTVLEAKLASIPGLENAAPSQPADSSQTIAVEKQISPTEVTSISPAPQIQIPTAAVVPVIEAVPEKAPEVPSSPAPPSMTVQMHPRFNRYFKMLKMGVPAQAVKIKMVSEDADPNLLDTPDAPCDLPVEIEEENNSVSDSESD